MTICAFSKLEWRYLGLQNYPKFLTRIKHCEDGTWYYAPQLPLINGQYVIYHGTYGEGNIIGGDSHTYATLYDDITTWKQNVSKWKEKVINQ